MIQHLKSRQTVIKKQLKKLKNELSKLPDGQIVCYPNGKYSRWYLKTEHGLEWIPKKNRDFASKLAYKKYLEARIHDLTEENRILTNLYLNSTDKGKTDKSEENNLTQTEILLNNQHYAALLTDHLTLQKNKWKEWMQEDYPANPKYPEQKIHPTLSGIFVRSKSEATIERLLVLNHIPFRYEPAFDLEGMIVYSDFLIIHPKTEEMFIWEHFGMMDKQEYAHREFRKMEQYNNCGFRPDEKLIMTFESKTNPFTYQKAEEIIWKYFLN